MKGFVPTLIALATVALTVACSNPEEETAPTDVGETPTTNASPEPSSVITQAPTEIPSPTQTGTAKSILWRWGNVTLLVPEDSGISVVRNRPGTDDSPSGGATINLIRGDSALLIDADSGEVFSQQVASVDKADFQSVTETIDASGSKTDLPWPYTDESPAQPKVQQGEVMYWDPPPAAGLVVGFLVRDGYGYGDEVLYIQSARSRRFVDAHTGEVVPNNDQIDPDDAGAFERWTAAIEVARSQP
jgi:hypothetical protein